MSNDRCPVLSPEQRKFLEIREAAEMALFETIEKAVADAAAGASEAVRSAGLEFEPTHQDYFAFAAQQMLFVRLCGGDPRTLAGGDPETGDRILRNGRHIIDRYWRGNTIDESAT
ncbi:MAG: hypothetical protein BGO05_07120 [Rhizobiales bacterium 63-7]|mgnify:CR=1 FL=1|nr:hypothetical protein [Hyphomicrobiales bacterium]OJU68543.1 MAG: hypothetical protein BGO05_07120 [Rhizobiales bacterium 63-7]